MRKKGEGDNPIIEFYPTRLFQLSERRAGAEGTPARSPWTCPPSPHLQPPGFSYTTSAVCVWQEVATLNLAAVSCPGV